MANNNISKAFENVRICFRNFSGKASQYNAEGNRNFCMIFNDQQQAEELAAEGWNIKYLQPRDEDDEPTPYMQVKVAFGQYPPKIVMITSGGQTLLDEDNINLLDTAEIVNVDLIVRPYTWSVRGQTGVKAYVKAMYVTIAEDEFEKKYRAMETSAIAAMTDDLPF